MGWDWSVCVMNMLYLISFDFIVKIKVFIIKFYCTVVLFVAISCNNDDCHGVLNSYHRYKC